MSTSCGMAKLSFADCPAGMMSPLSAAKKGINFIRLHYEFISSASLLQRKVFRFLLLTREDHCLTTYNLEHFKTVRLGL